MEILQLLEIFSILNKCWGTYNVLEDKYLHKAVQSFSMCIFKNKQNPSNIYPKCNLQSKK